MNSRWSRTAAWCAAAVLGLRFLGCKDSDTIIGPPGTTPSPTATVAAARKLGIRLWIMLRDEINYEEFCRRGRQDGEAHAEMPAR